MWYTALRLLVQSWEEEELLVLQRVNMNQRFDNCPCTKPLELKRKSENPENFFKFGRLRHHLIHKRELKGGAFRCIIFVQQRLTAVILSHFINGDPDLSSLGLQSGFVAARESKITSSIKMIKQLVADTIESFRPNRLNVIVATSVIEEVRRGFAAPAFCTPSFL